MSYVFGIDLGTTYSCIAYIDDTGRTEVLQNSEGQNTTPSVVQIEPNGNVVVGITAKETAIINEHSTVQFIKSSIGRTNIGLENNGTAYSPEEISAYILKKLAQDASESLGGVEVKDVVITCPAYFGSNERIATRNAGAIAGLNVLAIISEPIAAAFHYFVKENLKNQEKTFLVYDLGGGTFDATIISVRNNTIRGVCSDGDHDLGGKLWDNELMKLIEDRFREENHYHDDFDAYTKQKLRGLAERTKYLLSAKEEVDVAFDVGDFRTRIPIKRSEFNQITLHLLKSTIDKTNAAINEANKIAKKENTDFTIQEILLVGGSTKMPQIKEAIENNYPGIPFRGFDQDEAVAKGAAIYATAVYIKNQQDAIDEGKMFPGDEHPLPPVPSPFTLVGTPDILLPATKSYAVKAKDETEKLICVNMILINTPMPNNVLSVTQSFGTEVAHQKTALIEVFENDLSELTLSEDQAKFIGNAVLDLPANLPKGAPLEITLTLNNQGILEVFGKDLTSGNNVSAVFQTECNLNTKEVDEIAEKVKTIKIV